MKDIFENKYSIDNINNFNAKCMEVYLIEIQLNLTFYYTYK